MPDKEGAQEKSTTKEVVNKKQKQMMGEEGYDVARDEGRVKPSKDKKDATSYPVSDEMKKTQKKNEGPSALEIVKKKYGKAVMDMKKEELDLTKVAGSFGGEIIGEPVELDEMIGYGTAEMPKIDIIGGIYGGARMLDQIRKNIKIPNLGIKDRTKKVFDKIKNVMKSTRNDGKDNTRGETNAPPETETPRRRKRKKNINQDVLNQTQKNFFNKNNKNNKNKKPNFNKQKAAELTGAGTVGTGIGALTGKKGKLPNFRPRLPQTSHNIGRTSNPQ